MREHQTRRWRLHGIAQHSRGELRGAAFLRPRRDPLPARVGVIGAQADAAVTAGEQRITARSLKRGLISLKRSRSMLSPSPGRGGPRTALLPMALCAPVEHHFAGIALLSEPSDLSGLHFAPIGSDRHRTAGNRFPHA